MDVFVLFLSSLSYFYFLSITHHANFTIWSVIIFFVIEHRAAHSLLMIIISIYFLLHTTQKLSLVMIIFSLYFLLLHTTLTLGYCQILGLFYYTTQIFRFGFYHILGSFQYTPHWLSELVTIIFFLFLMQRFGYNFSFYYTLCSSPALANIIFIFPICYTLRGPFALTIIIFIVTHIPDP